jgi:hypothetical protein
MLTTKNKLSKREKAVFAGLYLSKFDNQGLAELGFGSFTEAFNVIGLAMKVSPASIKNYRDEFDPLFPNHRKGWHKRLIRPYCKVLYDNFHKLSISKFSTLLKSMIYQDPDLDLMTEILESDISGTTNTFAKRLITGQAAEQYFRNNFSHFKQFNMYELEDTTKFGCGFDFKLTTSNSTDYIGVEVKGLNGKNGTVSLTSKEHAVAQYLKQRYYICLVRNFKESPIHDFYQNPLKRFLFKKTETLVTSINWSATL